MAKEILCDPYHVSAQTTQVGVLYTFINEKLAIIVKFSPNITHKSKAPFCRKMVQRDFGQPTCKYFNDTARHLTAVSQGHFKVNYYITAAASESCQP